MIKRLGPFAVLFLATQAIAGPILPAVLHVPLHGALGVAVDPLTGYGYVTAGLAGGYSEVMPNGHAAARETPTVTSYGAAIDPVRREIWLPASDTGTVYVDSLVTPGQGTTIPLPGRPMYVALDHPRQLAYVSTREAGTLEVIDMVNRSVIGQLGVGCYARAVAVHEGDGRVFATRTACARQIVAFSVDGEEIWRVARPSCDVEGLDVHEASGVLVVACQQDDLALVLSVDTGETVATIRVGDNPVEVAVDDARDFAWVANYASGTVSAFPLDDLGASDVRHRSVVGGAFGIAVDEIRGRVYVANYGPSMVTILLPESLL